MKALTFRLCLCALAATVYLAGAASAAEQTGVPVQFSLDKAGYVTIVIEDEGGHRVCNLISDTYFDAGDHTIWWDGYDVGDLQTDDDNNVSLVRRLVKAGTYRARGMIHDDIQLKYSSSVQSPGNPPWKTPDRTGGWLADHTPAQSVLYIPDGTPYGDQPQLMFGATVAEAGNCVMWLDEQGNKLYGGKFVGWRGPSALASDAGPKPNADFYAYALVYNGQGFDLFGLPKDDPDYTSRRLMRRDAVLEKRHPDRRGELAKLGMAVWNGVIAYTPPLENCVEFFDSAAEKVIGTAEVDGARGIALDEEGRLFVLSGTGLIRYDEPDFSAGRLNTGTAIVQNLEDPRAILAAQDGNIYVADWGSSHQVKVYKPDGTPVRVIGKPGGQQIGLYDETQMCRPGSIALDSRGKLWVAEVSYAPKRISVWDAETAAFSNAFYGPPRYGGGGCIDPRDKTRYYYNSGGQGIEFKLEWGTNKSKPRAIYALREITVGRIPATSAYKNGNHYMVNPFIGPAYFKDFCISTYLYDDATGTVQCIARAGGKHKKGIKPWLQEQMDKHPAVREKVESLPDAHFWIWSDINLDTQIQAAELQGIICDRSQNNSSVAINEDFSITTAKGLHIPPPRFLENGVPVWDGEQAQKFSDYRPHLSDIMHTPDDYFVWTMGTFSGPRDCRGLKDGEWMWKINGEKNAIAEHPGELIKANRTIGFPVKPQQGDGGWMFCLNGYHGSLYMISSDGMYVTDLAGDRRTTPGFGDRYPEARAGMLVDDISFGEEHFWPAMEQAEDGTIYLMAGHPSSNIFEVVGLETIRRIGPWPVDVSAQYLAGKNETLIEGGSDSAKELVARLPDDPPTVDGSLDDWQNADWAEIDSRLQISGAIQVHGNMLYAAWRTQDVQLLNNNAPDGWQFAFATDGGLDLMLRTVAETETGRRRKHFAVGEVSPGDVRLFVTRKGNPTTGEPLAIRFSQNEGDGEAVTYSSPVGEVRFGSVARVSDAIRLAQKDGAYELAVPLDVFGLKVEDGTQILGDIGVVIGDGSEARRRVYWSNKAASMTSDIPSEAQLMPSEWGTITFKK